MTTTGINYSKVLRDQDPGNRKFSILIPSWNNLPYLQLCIASIRQNSSFNHQIIVHINEGRDGTLEWVRTQPDLDYTWSSSNIGICYALNLARNIAITPYIAYFNDDMYVCPRWDKVLHDEIEKIGHPLFFLSSTLIEPFTNDVCMIRRDFGSDIGTFNEAALLKEYTSLGKPDWQGATWPPNIVHKDVWDMVGGYSVEFSPGMYSDPDFSMKLWHNGVRLFKGMGESKVYHFGSKSTARVTRNKGYSLFISKWGMSPGSFTKLYLRRGDRFEGIYEAPAPSQGLELKNLFKRVSAAFSKH